jgi:hypothetical protein
MLGVTEPSVVGQCGAYGPIGARSGSYSTKVTTKDSAARQRRFKR